MNAWTLLTAIFVVLKLTNTITWSWWWVLSPAIVLTVLSFMTIILTVIVKLLKNEDGGLEL